MKKKIYHTSKLLLLAIALHLLPSVMYAQNSFQLNGNGGQADLGNDCYRLTQAVNNQFGSAWWRKKADLNQDFDLSANLNFGTIDGNGADGIVFAFQNVCTSSGVGGGGIGILGVTPSLFVEFDTWQNGNYNDPAFDHVAIMKNGDVTHNTANQLAAPVGIENGNPNVENGQDYLVRILWTHADSTLKVYVNNNLRISYTGNVVANIFSGNPYVYWGFTAATGGSNNLHKFCMVNTPTNTIKLSNATICNGGSYQVSLPGYSSYNWSPNTNISSTTSGTPVLSPVVSTTYYVTVTDACNNQQTDSIRITVNPLPNTQLTLPFFQQCLGAPAVPLSGGTPAGGTFGGNGVANGQFSSATAGVGQHWIYYTATNNFNCTATDSNLVTVNQLPNASILGSFSPVCVNGSPVTLGGGSPAGGTYTGNGVSAGVFNPAAAGVGTHAITYTYTDPNTGCTGSASRNIVVNNVPAAIFVADDGTVICNNVAVDFNTNAVNGVSYQWNLNGNPVTNLAAGNTHYGASVAGTYTLLAVSNGCSATSTASVVTNGVTPTATISSASTSFCPGASVVINSSLQNGETINWYLNNSQIPNATSASYIADAAGDYKAVITSATFCKATSNIVTLTQLPNPNATATASLPAFCPGTGSITLTATAANGATLQWLSSGAEISGQTNSTYSATGAGSYSIEATLNGCKDTSTTIVLNNATNPDATLSTADSTFCTGTGEVSVTATSGATYAWLLNGNAIAGNTNIVSVTQNGLYSVIVTSSDQCSATSNAITMTEVPAPTAAITASTTTVCSGNSATLTATPVTGATYEWFRNGNSLGTASANNIYDATQAGSYNCVVNDGCTSISSSVTLTVSTVPGSPTTLLNGTDQPCYGGFDTYEVQTVAGATGYTWTISPANAAFVQSGQGTATVLITFLNQNCTINVSAFNACGASASTSLPVTMDGSFFCNGSNVAFGAAPSATCTGSTVTFYNYSDQTAVGGLVPAWDFGAGANPATSSSSGPVTVTYSSPGFKTVSLSYNDGFGNFVDGIGITDYINVNGSVSTSAITGTTQLNTCTNNVETYAVTNTPGSTYNWTVNGGTITSGQGTNTVTVSFATGGGSVSVTETNAGGCVGSPQSVTVSCPVGLQNLSGGIRSLSVYPNPSTGFVTVECMVGDNNNGSAYELQLMNVEGRTILAQSGNIISGEFKSDLQLSELPKGVYFVRIKLEGEVISRKVVLQ